MKPTIIKVVTEERGEEIRVFFGGVNFWVTRTLRDTELGDELTELLTFNPREMHEIAEFEREYNGDYQREQTEKKLQENIEKLG